MFVGTFHNGPKEGHLSKYLAQKLALSLAELVIGAECYIKGEESNIEKKVQEIKERVPIAEVLHQHRKSYHTSCIKGNISFKKVGKTVKLEELHRVKISSSTWKSLGGTIHHLPFSILYCRAKY